MILHRKDEIVQKAAESNQLLMDKQTPVQFLQDYYSKEWHVKAGTLAYVKVGTTPTTITESNGKESVECIIIAELVASKDRVYIDAIASDDGTLLLKGEKREPCHYKKLFAPPSDGDLHAMKQYEEVEAKILKDADSCDVKITIASMIIILIGAAFIILRCFVSASDVLFDTVSWVLFALGCVCTGTGFVLFCVARSDDFCYGLFESSRLTREKKALKEELKRRDAENVKMMSNG